MSGKHVTLLATLVVATACSGTSTSTTIEAAPPTSEPATTTTAAVTTTSLAPTTTTVPATTTTVTSELDPLPDFVIDSDDPIEALDELIEIYNWLWRNPEPELLNTIFTTETQTFTRLESRMTELKANGHRHDDSGFVLYGAEIHEWDVEDVVVTLMIDAEWAPQSVVDEAKVEVEGNAGLERTEFRIALSNRLGTWRIVAFDGLMELGE